MARRRGRTNSEWETPEGFAFTWEHVSIEVLMDIREELRKLNAIIGCQNFIEIPKTLRSIDRKVTKPKKRKAKP